MARSLFGKPGSLSRSRAPAPSRARPPAARTALRPADPAAGRSGGRTPVPAHRTAADPTTPPPDRARHARGTGRQGRRRTVVVPVQCAQPCRHHGVQVRPRTSRYPRRNRRHRQPVVREQDQRRIQYLRPRPLCRQLRPESRPKSAFSAHPATHHSTRLTRQRINQYADQPPRRVGHRLRRQIEPQRISRPQHSHPDPQQVRQPSPPRRHPHPAPSQPNQLTRRSKPPPASPSRRPAGPPAPVRSRGGVRPTRPSVLTSSRTERPR